MAKYVYELVHAPELGERVGLPPGTLLLFCYREREMSSTEWSLRHYDDRCAPDVRYGRTLDIPASEILALTRPPGCLRIEVDPHRIEDWSHWNNLITDRNRRHGLTEALSDETDQSD